MGAGCSQQRKHRAGGDRLMPTTWNPSDLANCTLSGGNLVATMTGANPGVRSLDRVLTTGKYYWECAFTTLTNAATGVCLGTATFAGMASSALLGVVASQGGIVTLNGVSQGNLLGAFTAGDVCCIALDVDSSQVWFRRTAAGNWNGNASNNPATGVGGLSLRGFCGPGYDLYAFAGSGSGAAITANFGATGYSGTVPSGFVNIPTGTAVVTNDVLTQAALEQWGSGTPDMWATQLAVEMWGNTQTVNPLMIATQLALEMWAPVATVTPPVVQTQARAMILV